MQTELLFSLDLTTRNNGEQINDFTFMYKDHGEVREMLCVYKENDVDCVVMQDNDLPSGITYEVRSEGLWSDFNKEEDDHWSFSMESFALRIPIDEYIASHKVVGAITVGERIPFGYELDCVNENGQWNLEGFILVGKEEISFSYDDVEFVVTD